MGSYSDFDPNSSENMPEDGWVTLMTEAEFDAWVNSPDPNGSIESESGH